MVYIVVFIMYGTTNVPQVSKTAFKLKKDAEREAKELRNCGHTQVRIEKVEII